MTANDAKYLDLILEPVRACALYRPKFGQGPGDGLSLEQFQTLYQSDAFYRWFGLDNPLMYAAHKAAGGMTSIYRQIGIGCERVFRECLQDTLGIAPDTAQWSYQIAMADGKTRTLSLDSRVLLKEIADPDRREQFSDWMARVANRLDIERSVSSAFTGTVFEVRQGYKSKDAKRQNADIANAAVAYTRSYLPCAVILSSQIDSGILVRYRSARWMILTGTIGLNDPLGSTYDFMRDVVGYDLAGFFERNQQILQREINQVLYTLLTPESA